METEEQTKTEETIDPESICYIREMMEDWQNINFIKTINFTNEKVSDINKSNRGEFWIKTRTNNQQIAWLADTGSPRSFMNFDTAQKLLTNGKTIIKQPNKSIGEFRCFNNNKIDIIGTIQVDITSGSSNANNCTILLVNNNTINIKGRDIMDKLGLRLTMTTTNKVRIIYSTFQTHTNEYPNGYSIKTHTTQKTKNPITFNRRSREGTQKIDWRKTNQKINKMLWRTLHQSRSHHS